VTTELTRVDVDAQQLIREAQTSIPVKLASLAKRMGLKVIASTLPVGISGEIRPAAEGYVVSVNRHDSSRRQRFTVAHEIAHFLLHRDQIGAGISDDALYRSSLSDRREAEANRLAADILIPRAQLDRRAESFQHLPQDELVSVLAEEFDVSDIAMKIRLGLA
jgi:Zn-dependent peptidase ImmA (M78 family)